MSVDVLQEKIRKCKNPSVIDLSLPFDQLPPQLLENSLPQAYGAFCTALLQGLQGLVPCVRLSFCHFALLSAQGLEQLAAVSAAAEELGYYVLLDGVQTLSAQSAQTGAQILFDASCPWKFHGLITSSYIGTDGLKPYAEKLSQTNKSLFCVVRTGNKSASELQDMLSGPRLVHTAAADMANRLGDAMPGRCGYNQVGILAGASSADSLRALRSKYPRVFFLLDGYDYPNANAKNCSFAFDKFGHGAAACAGASITAAWQEAENDGSAYVELAVEAAERMKKNIFRYISVL